MYSLVANPLLLLLARVILVQASARMSSLRVNLPFIIDLRGLTAQLSLCPLLLFLPS